MLKYILGTLGLILGFILIWKSNWIVMNFGTVDWAERHLGTFGGTRTFWKLMGLLIIVIALLGISGTLSGILLSVLGPLFGGAK